MTITKTRGAVRQIVVGREILPHNDIIFFLKKKTKIVVTFRWWNRSFVHVDINTFVTDSTIRHETRNCELG